MAQIRVRVGAALDPEARNVFVPIVQAAERARAKISQEGKQSAREFTGGYRDAPAQAKKSFVEIGSAYDSLAKKFASSEKSAARDIKKTVADMALEKKKQLDEEVRDRKRALEQQTRDEERARNVRISASRRVVSGAASTTLGAARGAIGMAGQIARGAGVELDPAAYIRRSVELEKMAVNLSAASYHPGEAGPAGVRQDPKALISEIRSVADLAGVDTKAAMEGLAEFVSKTGELETGRRMMKDLAVLSQATGTNLDDMVSAAGEIASKFPEGTDKATATMKVLQAMAGQGKMGAVEIRHMATQIAKIGAVSGKFGMTSEQAMVELGIVTQVARAKGGAGKPAEATRAAQALIQSFAKESFLKNLQAGTKINPYDATGKNLRSPEELITQIVSKTQGDPRALGKIFRDVKSQQGIGGFVQIYNAAFSKAGGGKAGDVAGVAAIKAEFSRLRDSTVQQAEIQESFRRTMETSDAKVQQLNNQLERVAAEAASKLVPALIQLAPHLVKVAQGLGDLANFVAQNPIKSAIIVFGASIAKEVAAIGLKSIFEKALSGVSGGGGKMGLAIGAATIGITAGTIIAAHLNERTAAGREQASENLTTSESVLSRAEKQFKEKGSVDAETLTALKAEREKIASRIAISQEPEITRFDVLNPFSKKTAEERGEQMLYRQQAGTLYNEQKGIDALLGVLSKSVAEGVAQGLKQKPGGPQEVRVTNLPATPLGQPPPGTTTGIPSPLGT